MSDQDQNESPDTQGDSPAQGESIESADSPSQNQHPAEAAADRASESADAVAREVHDEANAGVPTGDEAAALERASQTAGVTQGELSGESESPRRGRRRQILGS